MASREKKKTATVDVRTHDGIITIEHDGHTAHLSVYDRASASKATVVIHHLEAEAISDVLKSLVEDPQAWENDD